MVYQRYPQSAGVFHPRAADPHRVLQTAREKQQFLKNLVEEQRLNKSGVSSAGPHIFYDPLGKGTIIKKGKHKGEQRYSTKKGGVRKTARKAYL